MNEIIHKFIDAMRSSGCAPANQDEIQPLGEDIYYRIDGDRKGKRGVYILTIESDGFAHGNFRNFKTSEKGSWHSGKLKKELTTEERASYAARIKAAEGIREQKRQEEYANKAIEARKFWAALLPATVIHPYLVKKSIQAHGSRVDGNGDLIIPILSGENIISYQRIQEDGGKFYLAGGRKAGGYYIIPGAQPASDKILICEGFSTGASLHEATGLTVIVAFDAGNLLAVATQIRAKYPEAELVVCADNDRFGSRNTGVLAAKAAADKVHGSVVVPEFPLDVSEEFTDFNDLHVLCGLAAVRDKVLPSAEGTAQGIHVEASHSPDLQPLGGVSDTEYLSMKTDLYEPPAPKKKGGKGDFGLPFKALGYNNGKYYYFPFGGKQIVELTPTAHTLNNLLQLATLPEWERRYPDKGMTHSKMTLYAWNDLKALADERGIFDEAESVRGTGAWKDAGRVVLHCGDVIYCDGVKTNHSDFLSGGYTYVASPRLMSPSANPLSSHEANRLRTICESLTWENKLSGSLLAGWLVIAPICGILSWRPHIWLCGLPGSGKSTAMNKIIKPTLGKMHLRVDGGSTEAYIRDKMGYSARPLVVDEAEKGADGKTTTMEAVVELARKASTDEGSVIGKFGQRPFKAQFMACFSSVNPPVSHAADIGRISFLAIKQSLSPTAMEDYNKLLSEIEEVITPDFPARLLDRTLENLPTLLENIKVFTVAARTILGAARAADQIGPMLAGLYLLSSTKAVSKADAEAWVAKHDWTFHTNIGAETDPQKLLRLIFASMIRVTPKIGREQTITIGELIEIALRGMNPDYDISRDDACRALRQFSIVVDITGIYIGNESDPLDKLISKTGFILGMGKWGRVLKNIEGVTAVDKKYFHTSNRQRATCIPLSMFDPGIE